MEYHDNQVVNISLHGVKNIPELIKQISDLFIQCGQYKNISINIDLDISGMIYPEYLAIIVCAFKYLETKDVNVLMDIKKPKNNGYVSRIDFYKHLNLAHYENFKRRNAKDNLVEITHFDSSNNIAITNNIMRVIKNNYSIGDSVLKCLNYCFFEIVGNIDTHADSPIGGYTAVQNYPNKKELRIAIVDTGKGIYESLAKTPNSKYTYFTPKQALRSCIEERITNGNGQGNGLFHTTRFIQENKGEMIIYSGNNYLHINDGKIRIFESAYWQGTIIYVKINIDGDVNLEAVFGENLPVTVSEVDDFIEELW